MSQPTLPPDARMGAVHLRVRDAARLSAFYRDTLGLRVLTEGANVELGVDEPLVVLHESRGAAPRPPGSAGLYHVALLLPTREDLGVMLRHLVDTRAPLQGASDHAVSEALYLSDPEGNGLELYADRPREQWRRPDGEGMRVEMVTRPLDAQDLVDAAGSRPWCGMPERTRVGHVHLQADDVPAAEKFYTRVVGLHLTARYGEQASFYAAGGYHHHVATNAWGVRPGARANAERLGLARFTLHAGDAGALDALEARLRESGAPTERVAEGGAQSGGVLTRDPAGNALLAVA